MCTSEYIFMCVFERCLSPYLRLISKTLLLFLPGLINYTELTEYLVNAVSSMQTELQVARQEVVRLRARCCELEGKLEQVQQNNEEFRQMQEEHGQLRSHLDGVHLTQLHINVVNVSLINH